MFPFQDHTAMEATATGRKILMGNTKTSKGPKGKKGKKGDIHEHGGGPIYVVLEKETAMDLFLALAQALGAPIDKKKKGKKKEKGKGKKGKKGKKGTKGTKGPKGPKGPKTATSAT